MNTFEKLKEFHDDYRFVVSVVLYFVFIIVSSMYFILYRDCKNDFGIVLEGLIAQLVGAAISVTFFYTAKPIIGLVEKISNKI